MAGNNNDGATRLGAHNGRDHESVEAHKSDRTTTTDGRRAHESEAHDKFGGVNIGASFFGWIVAIGIAILLTSIVGAIGSAVGFSGNLSQSDAERQAGSIGIASAIVLLLVLMIAYYAGGYVAGRMSRFDGGRQGLMVWLIGLLVTIAAADAALDPTVAYMQGKLKSTGSTAALLEVLRNGEATAAISRLASRP